VTRGYVISHKSYLFDGIRADFYRNDPYVWFSPYLWSFCHLNQHPRVDKGMTVLWLSKDETGTFVCDLVFVVGEIVAFADAWEMYGPLDQDLARRHFAQGAAYHEEVRRPGAKTYVANMARSFIPHPAVPLEAEVDAARLSQSQSAKPIRTAWRRPSSPLIIADIESLEQVVASRAQGRVREALGAGGVSPGQDAPLR
jgi:hypothetical protein